MEVATGELRRLRSEPGAEDDQLRQFLVRVRFAAEDPAQVISRARAVLTRVIEQVGDRPAFEHWPQLLPAWFVSHRSHGCAPRRAR
ncbi:hypothetical protein [Kitasatospora sp. SUK 42]|uniref:hypothetical protein n=1 Tax=Kitasatospora sp. SUK 42 TaxID=1588882 RepID=UPI0018CA98EA|nr:hypothetical protein [Kitasatospora sp. SUK 42]MBV2155214.1 hypothetical protein [Kitasatospora sp. SUK 42]